MPATALPAVFTHLASQRNAAVDDALLEALPEMEDELRPAALQIILRRAHEPVLAELVRRFDDWPGTVRRMLVTGVARISDAVRHAIASDSLPARLGAIETIRYGRLGSLAYLLTEALKGECPRTRQAAGKVLAELALDLKEATERRSEEATESQSDEATKRRSDEGNPPARSTQHPALSTQHSALSTQQSEDRQARARHASHIALALTDAVHAWERHTRVDVLHAALWLADRIEPALKARIEQPRSKFAHAVADAITDADDPRLAAFTLRALKFEVLTTTAASALEHCRREPFIRAMLGQAQLLDDPAVRRGLKRVREPAWLKGGVDVISRLEPQLQERAVRFIGALGSPRTLKHGWYRDLLAVAADGVRQAVVSELCREPGDAAVELLARVAERRDDPAGEAARRWIAERGGGATAPPAATPTSLALSSSSSSPAFPSPSPSASAPARPAVGAATAAAQPPPPSPAAASWNAFWDSFDSADAQERQRQAAALPGAVPDLVELIRRKLAGPQARDRLRALRIAGHTGVTEELAEDIYRAAHDADALVRSTAVSLLAALPGATGRRILRQALNDPDDRVQANAIEALEAVHDEHRDRAILPKLNAAAPRVRANAIKALLRLEVREAGDALLRMLEDSSPAARLSALWVVERLDLRSLTQRLVEMSLRDPDEKIQRRARRIVLGISPQAHRTDGHD